ncbi:lipid-binding SYLF domain-containing protein [Arcticibacter tournemirensis]|uniref:Ysc84 actin-binding domain-containing protein n=1 Tax=Arcticibacter tournemirensis TaxID=699437 RepID=A0A4Q0MEQ9_9SPHI|nr:lipid-binding SYLF domain-containing protein [Arcticibacter tournemirensis]RXF71951.1 hypothetical protein EKH83_04525 [Arcticibacter tournemirensis]
MKTLKYFCWPALMAVFMVFASATDAGKETKRLEKSTQVLKDFAEMKESIPSELLKIAEGIIVVPNLINAGLGIGGKHGKGVAVVKTASGAWSNPVFVAITGGSLGLQAGVQSVDLVLVFKHKSTLTKITNSDFTLGGDISVAAGPVGRSSTASTNVNLEAEVYSYSRSKGLFAGITLSGSNISLDKTANSSFYGSSAGSSQFSKSTSTNANIVALRSAVSAL